MASEWEGYLIYEPEEPDDYFGNWINGWVFGLPEEGEISSDSCGAMPFRDGMLERGLKAKKCMRGEDWAWIETWCDTHHGMFSRRVFEDYSLIPALTYQSPRLKQLSGALNYTSSVWSNWGQAYSLSNQEVQRNAITAVLASGLSNNVQMKQHIPDELSGDWENAGIVNVPFRLSCVQNIFDDISALQCTLGDLDWNGSVNPLYSYSQQDKDHSPVITSKWLSGMYHWDGYYFHPYKKISLTMQPYAVLRVSHSDFDGDYRYVTYKVGTQRTVQNTEQNTGRFDWPSMTGGDIIAQGVAQILGIDLQPAATGYTRTFCEINVDQMYAAFWPRYMQLGY